MKEKSDIAGLSEIAVFWTKILRDEESELKDKLKVTELLSRFSADLSGEKNGEDDVMSLDECYEYIQRIKNEPQTEYDT